MAQIDYLRVGTYDWGDWVRLKGAAALSPQDSRAGRFLQYKGHYYRDGHVFYGEAVIGGKMHYMAQISGESADGAFDARMADGLIEKLKATFATRIDLQRTISLPPDYDAAYTYKTVRDSGSSASLILSDEGATVYLGKRSSDKFTRLYVKNERFLRLEFELKGRIARNVWDMLTLRQASKSSIYVELLNRCKFPSEITEWFRLAEDVSSKLISAQIQQSMARKIDWLLSLDAAMYKLLADHEYGPRVLSILERWIEFHRSLRDDSGESSERNSEND